MKATERPEWMKVSEIAAELRVTERVVYKWLKEGTLRGVLLGGVWRVSREEFELFIHPTAKEAA